MEKKTIGKFIAVLRKANGMTQKEMGEKLFVSDKTVSRWERDECTPELCLIPVIAEIFDVTVDELLRGQRITAEASMTQAQRSKADKQFKAMVYTRKVRFRNVSMISIGFGFAGLILALAVNFSFQRGVLAFGIGSIMLLAGLIFQLCCLSVTRIPLEEDCDYAEQVNQANSQMVWTTARVIVGLAILFASILPAAIWSADGYSGLSVTGWLLYGLLFAAVAAMLCYAIYVLWIERWLIRADLLVEHQGIGESRTTLKRVTAAGCIVMLFLMGLLLLHAVLSINGWAERHLADKITFDNYEDFAAFMEENAVAAWKQQWLRFDDVIIPPDGTFAIVEGNVVHYPENTIVPLKDDAGNILCYYDGNTIYCHSVTVAMDEKTNMPIICVYTAEAMGRANKLYQQLKLLLLFLITLNPVICAVIACVLFRKKK